jgi:hypothetical protein
MKPFRVLLLILTFSTWLPQPGQAFFFSAPAPVEFHTLLNRFNSPEDLAHWMHHYFKFTDDQKIFGEADYWQSPEEFLKRGKGDCEDYALFAKSILEHMGIEAYVVSFYGKNGYAHTIVIYKQGGLYNIFNEDKVQKSEAKTFAEALSYVHPGWTWAGISEKQGNRGRMVFPLEPQ